VLSVSSWPLYRRVSGWIGNRHALAAAIMALAMILIVVLPFVVVGASLADNVKDFTTKIQGWTTSNPPSPPGWLTKVPVVGRKVTEHWQSLIDDKEKLQAEAQRLLEPLSAQLLLGALALGAGLMHLTLSIFIAFFLFRDGEWLGERVTVAVDRVAGEHGKHLLSVATSTIRGVVYGILGTALVQGLLTGAGLLIAGVPNVALLTLLAFFSSVVPVVGPALVWLPAALWLFSKGATTWGIFLIIWGAAVNQIDNFLKPYLISKGSDMPFILIFFGVLGGAIAFGFIGVFLGPTLLAVGYRLLSEWNTGKKA